MKKLFIYGIIIIMVISFTGCPQPCGENGNDDVDTAIVKDNIDINMANVSNFLISENEQSEKKLYVQLSSNIISPVNLTSGGEETVSDIFDTPNFVLFPASGVKADDDNLYSMVLARKSDGALFGIKDVYPMDGYVSDRYFEIIQTDATGDNIFISSYYNDLLRFDVSNPDSPNSTTIVDDQLDGSVWDMAVNGNGDVFCSIVNDGGSTRIFRIYKKMAVFIM